MSSNDVKPSRLRDVIGEVAQLAAAQLAFDMPTPLKRRRKKLGRKRTGRCSDSPHRPRPVHLKRDPVHVVLRVRPGGPRLRRRVAYTAIRQALGRTRVDAFRVVHVSVQHNHLHFLVEAEDRIALSRGMQGLAISIARRINKEHGRTGKLFAHRFHATPIHNPRQARNALAYVLNNWRRHREDQLGAARGARLDPYSSAVAFDGWRITFAVPEDYTPLPVAAPETWLLRVGWRRGGPLLDWREVPSKLRR
jgi:REP element-mobilizing transposase RayT